MQNSDVSHVVNLKSYLKHKWIARILRCDTITLHYYKVFAIPVLISAGRVKHLKTESYFLNKQYFLWNCPQVNATQPYWWLVSIGSGNGLGRQATSHYLNQWEYVTMYYWTSN